LNPRDAIVLAMKSTGALSRPPATKVVPWAPDQLAHERVIGSLFPSIIFVLSVLRGTTGVLKTDVVQKQYLLWPGAGSLPNSLEAQRMLPPQAALVA
jgi:hypothetical protein